MRWNSEPTHRLGKTVFAWLPVLCHDGTWVWLENVLLFNYDFKGVAFDDDGKEYSRARRAVRYRKISRR